MLPCSASLRHMEPSVASSQPCLCQESFQPSFAAPAADCTSFCGEKPSGQHRQVQLTRFHGCLNWSQEEHLSVRLSLNSLPAMSSLSSISSCGACVVLAGAETSFARPVRKSGLPIQRFSTSKQPSFLYGFCHISMSEELDCHDFFFHAANFMPNSQSRNESCFCWEVGVAHSHHNTKPCCALSQESFQPSHITAAAHCTSGCGEWCQQLSFASPSSLASSERWTSMTGGGGICCSDLSESCHPFHPVRHKARTSRASHLPPLPGPRRFLA